MPTITQVHTALQTQAAYLGLDENGDVVTSTAAQGVLRSVTPLAAMELYEQLHAARNEVRRAAGLAEIPTPDEGLLVLAFLKGVAELQQRGEEPNLADLGSFFRCLVQEVQEARLEALPEMNGREPAEVR
jgi:hypothetical protein